MTDTCHIYARCALPCHNQSQLAQQISLTSGQAENHAHFVLVRLAIRVLHHSLKVGKAINVGVPVGAGPLRAVGGGEEASELLRLEVIVPDCIVLVIVCVLACRYVPLLCSQIVERDVQAGQETRTRDFKPRQDADKAILASEMTGVRAFKQLNCSRAVLMQQPGVVVCDRAWKQRCAPMTRPSWPETYTMLSGEAMLSLLQELLSSVFAF